MPSTPRIASFLYHDVVDDLHESGLQRAAAWPYKLSRAGFDVHLDAIASCGSRPVRVVDVDFTRPGRHVMLTFDDGGKSALHVAERLNRRGWNAHFFIITSAIGTAGFLTPGDIRYLRTCGHLVGSHSHTHPDIFKALSLQEMLEEWRTSADVLSQALGEPCVAASVPGGDSSTRVYESAARAGLSYLFTSEPTVQPHTVSGCRVLGRMSAKARTAPSRIGALARFHGWHREMLVRRSKVLLRTALFPLYALYVARTTREWTGERGTRPAVAKCGGRSFRGGAGQVVGGRR